MPPHRVSPTHELVLERTPPRTSTSGCARKKRSFLLPFSYAIKNALFLSRKANRLIVWPVKGISILPVAGAISHRSLLSPFEQQTVLYPPCGNEWKSVIERMMSSATWE